MSEVFVGLFGGLGNQMFQAAFAIALERRFGAEVRLLADRGSVDAFGRRYLLGRFPLVDERVIGSDAAEGVLAYGEAGASAETLAALFAEQPRVALHGYWQDERFFFGEEQAIAAALRLEPDAGLAGRVEAVNAPGSIGLHVRRAEYGHHGLATVGYYRDAVASIRAEVGPAPVLCFTDEPHFARFVFQQLADVTVMDPTVVDPVDDFYVLSRCRHFVIANSSFSWWAAWLGVQPDSIVYAPLPWCAFNPELDPAPTRWRRVENAVRGP
jgi:hypothetical protein